MRSSIVARRTSSRPVRAVSVAGVLLCAVLLIATMLLIPRGIDEFDEFNEGSELANLVLVTFFVLTMAAVGGLIVSRYPSNAVGWILIGTALSWAGASFGLGYIEHSRHVGELPGVGYFIITQALWIVGLAAPATMLPLLFPTGRPLNKRWSWLVWAAIVLLALSVVSATLAPEPYLERLGNPYATPMLRDLARSVQPLLFLALLPVSVASVVSLFLRVRRSGWRERQQLKWFLFAVALVVVAAMVVTVLEMLGIGRFGNLVSAASLSVVPLAIGVAVLRHGLYDIDLVINRTLVYTVLTGLLAVAYLGLVVLLQRILAPVTLDSDLAVAGSTLAVAALFRPLRTRVQSFIDRRFYRHKYDASETLEAFSSTLRDEIDLESLSEELVTVVGSTMQPAHVSVWLKDSRLEAIKGAAS